MNPPRIVFCVTCRNRTAHLRQTLPQNLADNPRARFVVLDYNSPDDLLDYLFKACWPTIVTGQLVVYSEREAPIFRMAHAKNMAHRLGILEGADILVNLDADNLTGPGFAWWLGRRLSQHRRQHGDGDVFFWADMIKGVMPRGISGRIAVTVKAFLKAGGYDEQKFNGWGSDDKDFNLRLRMIGAHGIEIDPAYLDGISHNDKMRFKEYPHLAGMANSYFEVSKATVERAVVNGGTFGCGTVYRNRGTEPVVLAPVPTRIFGIGMHKTGTTSLHRALEILGYDSWHWLGAHSAKAIWREMNEAGRSPTVEQYQALCDLPIPMLFRQLDAGYPGSKFILTIRGERAWLDAARRHFDSATNKWQPSWNTDPFTHRVHNLLYGRKTFDAEVFLARYRRHNAEVLEYFRERPGDLLVMNMDAGAGWSELCRFLGHQVPEVPYPLLNNGRGVVS